MKNINKKSKVNLPINALKTSKRIKSMSKKRIEIKNICAVGIPEKNPPKVK